MEKDAAQAGINAIIIAIIILIISRFLLFPAVCQSFFAAAAGPGL